MARKDLTELLKLEPSNKAAKTLMDTVTKV